MTIRPIRTKRDYEKALKRIETLWGAKPSTPHGNEFDVLCTLVEAYEDKNFPIRPPDPIEAIKFRFEQMNMNPYDAAQYLGGKRKVNALLRRRATLTMTMAKVLHKRFGVPAESLLS